MRRVLRIFLNVTAAISLVLAVGVAWMWVRSYQKPEWWSQYPYDVQTHMYGQHHIGSERGKGVLIFSDFKIDDSFAGEMADRAVKGDFNDRWQRARLTMTWPTLQHWWERVVFVEVYKNVRMQSAPGIGGGIEMIVPHCVLVAACLIWPGVWGVRGWTRRRWRPGMCRNCGYDLRASPERCPECGAAVGGSGVEARS